MPKRRETPRPLRTLVLGFTLLAVSAAAGAAVRDLSFNASLQETLTDNSSGASGDSDLELVSAASAGTNLRVDGGATDGNLGLQLRSLYYHQDSSRNTTFVTGNGLLSSELVRNYLFLDVGGSVSRHNASAFGVTSVDDIVDGDNRNLVQRYFVSPRLAFGIGSNIRGSASHRITWTDDEAALDGTRRQMVTSLGLQSAWSSPLGWSVDYVRTRTSNDPSTGEANLQTLRARVSYLLTDRLTAYLTAGREENDFETGEDIRSTIRGAGFDWVLTPRTRVSAGVEKRFFGTAYNYAVTHSRPLSSVQLSYSRDVRSIEDVEALSLADLAFRDFFISLAASIPDPVERAQVASALAASVPNGDSTFVDFVTSSFSVSRRLSLTGSLVGAHNVLTVAFNRNDNERLGRSDFVQAEDDFAQFNRIVLTGVSVALSHRLSGRSAAAANFSVNRSRGAGERSVETTRRALTLSYNAKIGGHTDVSASLRRQKATGSSDFVEHALVGTVSVSY